MVTAIHRVEQQGAIVQWNERINGRQFDVTIRFKAGNYSYLTVVECKNTTRPVETKEIESLATKSARAKANKAILVSSSGFQSGCFEEATPSGIELFTLKEINDLPIGAVEVGLVPVPNYRDFKLSGPKEAISLPEHRNILLFLLKETIINTLSRKTSIHSLLQQRYRELDHFASKKPKTFTIYFDQISTTATLPDIISGNTIERITVPLSKISFVVQVIPAMGIRGTGLDPYLSLGGYQYTNVVTGEVRKYSKKDLSIDIDTTIKSGCFYADAFTDFRYYCHGIKDNQITMTMLEGYQHGKHLQVTFVVLSENAKTYIEIIDQGEISRLKAMIASIERIGGPL